MFETLLGNQEERNNRHFCCCCSVAKHAPPSDRSAAGESLEEIKMKMGCFMNDLYWILILLVILIRWFYFRWIFFLSSLPMSLHYWKKIHLRVWNLKLENSLFAGCYSWWERSRPQLMVYAPPPFSWASGGCSFQILRQQRAAAVERRRVFLTLAAALMLLCLARA